MTNSVLEETMRCKVFLSAINTS